MFEPPGVYGRSSMANRAPNDASKIRSGVSAFSGTLPVCIALVLAAGTQCAVQAADCFEPTRAQTECERGFVRAVASMDLVIAGRLRSFAPDSLHVTGGCGIHVRGARGKVRYTIAIDSVIVGRFPDPTIDTMDLDPPFDGVVPGVPVIAYGAYSCIDGWRFVGCIEDVDSSGRLSPHIGSGTGCWQNAADSPPTPAEFLRSVRAQSKANPPNSILTAAGLFQVRVLSTAGNRGAGFVAEVDSLAASGNHSGRCPRVIIQEPQYCPHEEPAVGDTLVLPGVSAGGDTLRFHGCLGAVTIVQGVYHPLQWTLARVMAQPGLVEEPPKKP